MSNSSTYVLTLSAVGRYLSLTINCITLITGTIGSICNVITFTAPQLRRNACVFYLLCANIFQLISILFIVPDRIASDNIKDNLEQQSIIYCKIRYYLILTLPELATYYLLLSTLDRCLSTCDNVRMRAWSQLKVAYRSSVALFIIGFVSNIHVLVYYNIYNNNCQSISGSPYTLFSVVYLLIIVILLPYTIMLILCIITFMNMKRTKRRVTAISNVQNQQPMRRFEVQIIMVIVLQVVVSSMFASLRVGSYLYSTLTSGNLNKTTEERAAEGFTLQLGISLSYFNFAMSFYVSTLTSKYFRDIFSTRITGFRRRYFGQL